MEKLAELQPSIHNLFSGSINCVARRIVASAKPHRFCAGYALFSWLFLVMVLRGGFISADDEANWLLRTSGFGAMVAVICGMIANWILPFGFSCSSKSAQTKSDPTASPNSAENSPN